MPRVTAEEKRKRLALIYGFIQNHPNKRASLEDISRLPQLAKLGERQIRNYMYDLEALGLVVYNKASRSWVLGSVVKREFASKADYELALKHSKNLLFSTKGTELFDEWIPETWAWHLAYGADQHEILKLLNEHLKTGYFEIYTLIEKYRRIFTGLTPEKLKEYEVVPRPITVEEFYKKPELLLALTREEGQGQGKIRVGISELKGVVTAEEAPPPPPRDPVPLFVDDASLKAERERHPEYYNWKPRVRINNLPRTPEEQELAKKIAEKLSLLMVMVRQGTPLNGECYACPHKHITVKDESS
jgi:hypothetical protein